MRLILTEKPSVARDFAKALGLSKRDGYFEGGDVIVTWAYGHLYENAPPEAYDERLKRWSWEGLPILPREFKRVVRDANAKRQLRVIRELLGRPSEVVVATDAEREGELIAREILEELGWRGKTLRFWTSLSLTPEVVKRELRNLKPASAYDRLYHAALARQRADWLVGMNLSRAATLAFGKKELFSVGRVQTAVLGILVDRQIERENFKPKPYWVLEAVLKKDGASFRALWAGGSIFERDKARALLEKVRSAERGTVVSVERKKGKTPPPILYDLTTLQQDASKRFGFSPKRTLNAAQRLYEERKCLSYPRTESRHLGRANFDLVKSVLDSLSRAYPRIFQGVDLSRVSPDYKRVFDDAKLTDHHALIPLKPLPDDVSDDERKIYDLVLRRFAAAFHPDQEWERVSVLIELSGEKFRASGRTVLSPGWTSVFAPDEEREEGDEEEPSGPLPRLEKGDEVAKQSARLKEKKTQPPPEYTEASLLDHMKNPAPLVEDERHKKIFRGDRGLGTQATRADILETLIRRGYVERKGKKLIPTAKGRFLIEHLRKLPRTRAFTLAEETARWEAWLADIARGARLGEGFLDEITVAVKDCVAELKSCGDAGARFERERKVLGRCPLCGGDVVEGKKGYGCSNWKEKGCGFVIWKEFHGKRLPESAVRDLLSGKTTRKLRFRSRSGKTFEARLRLTAEGKVEFCFEDRKKPK